MQFEAIFCYQSVTYFENRKKVTLELHLRLQFFVLQHFAQSVFKLEIVILQQKNQVYETRNESTSH